MQQCAIIDTDTNTVINIIDYDTVPTGVPPGLTGNVIAVANNGASIGWTYQNGTFTDPNPPPALTAKQQAQLQYATAVAAGLVVDWSTSTALNATYALDKTTQFNAMSEVVSINTNSAFTNGQQTKNWPDAGGTYHSFTVAQFKAFATQVALYLDNLVTALATASAGQTATWPSATVTINL